MSYLCIEQNNHIMSVNQLILKAHYNLTYKKGKRDYAPTAFEIQKEIDVILTK